MSSDEIFAAQMWPWPDPMLKRDVHGRIIFVNAAFLRIYGGQVSDWHGNSVGGWPAPMGGPAPNRFETRLPTAEGESVYDWIEYTLADGGTLGIARDVTELLPAPEPDPAYSAVPPQMDAVAEYIAPPQAPVSAPPAYTPAQAMDIPAETASAPTMATQAFAPSAEAEAIPQFDIPNIEADPVDIPQVDIPQFEAPAYEAPQEPMVQPEPAPEAATEPVIETLEPAPVSTSAPLQPADRDYERRALPIENEDSVLGTNWRDAVIAKAVGNALPQDANAAPEPEATPEPSIMKSDGPLRILLAEDNAINALLTRTLLEADGCQVDVVEDGALAVEAMKNQSYDMVFMDMRMPNMDGLESTRKIRALPNVPKSLPIVALTANAFDDDRNACFDSGMNDFMTKPVSAEELADMVNQWARKDQEEAA